MPNRIIKESCRTSATLYKLSDAAERLFWRLVTVADDFGRFEADPAVMKAQCFPRWPDAKMSPKRVAALYAELEPELVQTYVVKGVHYGYFLTWETHQRKRAKHSKYLAPTPESLLTASDSTCQQMPSNVPEKREARSEESRSEESACNGSAPNGGPRPAPIRFEVPPSIRTALQRAPHFGGVPRLNGPEFWQAEVRANPGVDFAKEVLKAEAWLVAHPERAKKQLTRFLHNWLARADRSEE